MKLNNLFQSRTSKIILLIALAFIIFLAVQTGIYLKRIYSTNIEKNEPGYLYIHTGATFTDVFNELERNNFLKDRNSFIWLSGKMNYVNRIKPGRYKITPGMSNKDLIVKLRSGEQEPVDVPIHDVRTIPQLAGLLGRYLELDSIHIVEKLSNEPYLDSIGFNKNTILAMFIPNTYEFYWNISADKFFQRMLKEYNRFWTTTRKEKAKSIGLSQNEVFTLASIVEEETNGISEYPIIAGVYMNRLKRNMPLQADPTVKYATGNFAAKRVLKKDTEFDSPYNTYRYKGLPPGPIGMPSIKAIDGVLNYQKHKYLYFCANADFSGFHVFANTLVQHNRNAEAFQREMNKRGIYR
jgi:UPF0755 protein